MLASWRTRRREQEREEVMVVRSIQREASRFSMVQWRCSDRGVGLLR